MRRLRSPARSVLAALAALLSVVALSPACASSAPAPDTLAPDYRHDVAADDLATTLKAEGYDVDVGTFGFFQVADCASLPNCYGNNPSSPYGLYFLPPAPGEPTEPLAAPLVRGDRRAIWRLREDEAVVFLGKTPPKARYMGFRSYLYGRAGVTDALFASLGDTTNELVMATGDGKGFDAETVVVTTADQALFDRLQGFFRDRGAGSIVNVDRLPRSLLKMGLGADADRLMMLFRVAFFDDAAAGDAYLSSPAATVLRIRPRAQRAIAPIAAPPRRERGTGTDESSLADALDAAMQAVKAAHAAETVTQVGTLALLLDGPGCIASSTACLGDNSDALYFGAAPVTLAAGERLVAIGVNHTGFGKTTYTNLSAYDADRLEGVAAVGDESFVAPAEILASHPEAKHLFVHTFARDCAGIAACTVVPTSEPGVPLAGKINLSLRAYLEPSTKTGPSSEELLPFYVFKVSPK